jgi:methanethiol S-methyltransferase
MVKVIVLLAAFAVVHSWLAGKNVKTVIRQRIGERRYHGFYRLAYNIFAVLTLAPAVIAAVVDRGQIIWQVNDFVAGVFILVQIVGIIGGVVSLSQIDWRRFAGLSQVMAYLTGQPLPLPDEPLQLRGMYSIVRHPLYLFSLLAIWPLTTMTEGLLAFNIGATLYFVFGSLLEERRLAGAFGDMYRDYQRTVPWLIPFPRIRQ